MNSVIIIIVALGLCAVGFSAVLALALSQTAARADEQLSREVMESRSTSSITVARRDYVGVTCAQSTISRESAIISPSSRRRRDFTRR